MRLQEPGHLRTTDVLTRSFGSSVKLGEAHLFHAENFVPVQDDLCFRQIVNA
jgi:hypothetical protein